MADFSIVYGSQNLSIPCRITFILITLHAKLSSAVYCNRSCLWVCVCVFVGLLPR